MADKFKRFTGIFSANKGKTKIFTLLIVIGIIGMALIGVSELIPKSQTNEKEEVCNLEKYISELEEKTQEMIFSIYGAGKCKIMITANASQSNVFALDKNLSNDVQEAGDEKKSKSQSETEIVFIETSGGKKQALVEKTLEPEIRGVLVLCEGADDINVTETITKAVKTVLGVPSNKICVSKLNTEKGK